jgi:transcription elongation factor GreA
MADGPVRWGEPIRSRKSGVFLVELAVPLAAAPIDQLPLRRWIERVPSLRLDGRVPTAAELAARLSGFWLADQTVLYVGRTAKSLSARVAALYATPLGDSRPHSGGHWLKTLRGIERLRVWWAETDAPEEYEDALLSAFAERVTADEAPRLRDRTVLLPFANRETATGERKVHGISGSLLTADTARPAASPTPSAEVRGPARPRTTRAGTPAARRVGTRRKAESTKPAPAGMHVSAGGLAKLSAELEELRTIRRPQVIARVKAARELGDLRENADYEAARNEQSFLEGRIQAIERMLVNPVLISDERRAGGNVILGSTVVLETDGQREEYTLVGSTESRPAEGSISGSSPVGRALLGRRVGDEVRVPLPRGEVTYRIVEVR